MQLISVLLLGIGAANSNALPIYNADATQVWDHFQLCFGKQKVLSSFSNSDSLANALIEEPTSSTHVGCSLSYEYGTELGMLAIAITISILR